MCAVFQRRSSRAAMARLMETGSRRGALKTLAAASRSASVDSIARENRDPSPTRTSALGIQMISKPLHRQIFGTEPRVSKEAVEKSKRHLKSHGIDVDGGHVSKKLRDVDLHLPRLLGTDINEHFVEIATQQIEPYLSLAKNLADANLPQMPKRWSCSPGWTKYEGNVATAVPCPDEEALVLDVEVCVRDSERPVLATAVSGTHWYSWVSERLVAHEDYDIGLQGQSTTARHLIPLEIKLDHHEPIGGTWRERLVVGHHVSYDRARTKEQYLMKGPRTRFLDTMSLHVCVAGQTAAQKLKWNKYKDTSCYGNDDWLSVSSPNGLADVHWLHVGLHNGSSRIDKDMRKVFVKGRIQDVRKQFQSLMRYCASDVVATHEVLHSLLPLFLHHCPHPVTLAGMLEMGGAYIPVDTSWEKYIADCEYTYEEMEGEMKAKLMALADDACTYMHREKYLQSPWLCNLDWSSKKFRGKAKKSEMNKLLEQLQGHYEQREREFRACGREGVEGDKGEGEKKEEGEGEGKGEIEGEGEEEEGSRGGKTEFFISSDTASGKRAVHMPGYPEWYRNLCMRRSSEQWCPGAVLVSAQTRVAPYLLRMKWKGFPLHHHGYLGWGYIVPPEFRPGEVLEWDEEDNIGVQVTAENCDEDSGSECALFGIDVEAVEGPLRESVDSAVCGGHWMCGEERDGGSGGGVGEREGEGWEGEDVSRKAERVDTPFGVTDDVVKLNNGKSYYFFKLPHKDGADLNVGNPLAKNYLHLMENGTLTSAAGHLGQRILTLNSMTAFWRSSRQRIMEQFVVWNERQVTSEDRQSSIQRGVILPQLAVAGTVTRRAVEPTWLTASNAKETRVGSELKAMVRAPDGYHIVGADVDSQELWIASVLGDKHFAGMHGSTAIGWMTLQGSKADGTDVHSNTASTIGISRDQAKILNYGRIYGAGRPFIELLLKQFNPSLTGREVKAKACTLLKATKGWKHYMTEQGQKRGVWEGGSESDLFNELESIASSPQPTTPVLSCRISRALETQYTNNSYFPSKVNWVVQSSAVDYLHLMLVATKWLTDAYNIDGRYCLSIHDEVRYIVKSEDRYRFALALQYANLLTRAMFSHRLDLHDLPMSVAFFSAVDFDKCMRKEATMDCKTPSNPLGLEKGHNIPQGEVLDIYELLEKTEGSLVKHCSTIVDGIL